MAGFDESFRTILVANPAKLSVKNKNLLIKSEEKEAVYLPLNDIAYIILESPQITLTSALLSSLTKSKTILLTCDESHIVNGIFTPFLGHFETNKVLRYQISIPKQQKAIIWQKIIKSKLKNQAILARTKNSKVAKEVDGLEKRVKLNDADGCEASAAAKYFNALFGNEFRRENLCFENSALNYVYSIIRSCMIKNIVSSGLLPTFGIWHDNVYNSFNLADDLMEPYRIYGDKMVLEMEKNSDIFLRPQDKYKLVSILDERVFIGGKFFTIAMAVAKTVQSYKNSLQSGECNILLPGLIL